MSPRVPDSELALYGSGSTATDRIAADLSDLRTEIRELLAGDAPAGELRRQLRDLAGITVLDGIVQSTPAAPDAAQLHDFDSDPTIVGDSEELFFAVRPHSDQRSSPGERLCLECRPGDNARLIEETVLPERVRRADAHRRTRHEAIEMTTDDVRWLPRRTAAVDGGCRVTVIVVTLAALAVIAAPAVAIGLALRRHRDLPPASVGALRRAERRRRLRLGLRT
jgi:hypothetical protein